MSETVRQDPLDRQRLRLLDRQTQYYYRLRQSGTLDKALKLESEIPESEDSFVSELADALEPFTNEPAATTLQIVPALEATV